MKKETIKESILNPVSMFIIGLLTGFLIKEIDPLICPAFWDFISKYFFGSRSLGSNRGEYQSVQHCIYRNFNLSAVHKKIYEDLICTGKPENLKKI